MQEPIFELMLKQRQEQEFQELMTCNERMAGTGVALTEEEVRELMICRNESLKKYRRAEFGKGILEKLIFTFSDSPSVNQEEYAEILSELQDIFYLFKNESADLLTDEELLTFMKEQLDGVCEGDLDYLKDTCLERFTRAVRAGYQGYERTGGHGEYSQFDEETRWDKDLYMQVVKELFWG